MDDASGVDSNPRPVCSSPAASKGAERSAARSSASSFSAASVPLAENLSEESLIGRAVREIAAATQLQGLVDCLLEAVVTLFGVAVLVGLPGVDFLHDQTVVIHQRLISPSELLAIGQVVHGRAHAIRAMALGHPSQFPQRLLQPLAEALEALGEADRGRSPSSSR